MDRENFTFCIFRDTRNRCFSVVRGATGVLRSRTELHFKYEMLVSSQLRPLVLRSLLARVATNVECRISLKCADVSLIQVTLTTDYSSNLSVPHYFICAQQTTIG
jgi:hypothetical protein